MIINWRIIWTMADWWYFFFVIFENFIRNFDIASDDGILIKGICDFEAFQFLWLQFIIDHYTC